MSNYKNTRLLGKSIENADFELGPTICNVFITECRLNHYNNERLFHLNCAIRNQLS